jgi:hypothetical protein
MVTQRVSGGNTTYFMGEVSATGWKTYFPTVYLIKETIAFHFFSLLAVFFGLWFIIFKTQIWKKPWTKSKELFKNNLPVASMLLFMGVYWTSSLAGNLNIGVRHLLPVFPFAMILAGAGAAKFINGSFTRSAIIGLLCLWQIVSIAAVYPSFLAYFNELAGGPEKGYLYSVDSNLDWGQDLKRLAQWIDYQNCVKPGATCKSPSFPVPDYVGPINKIYVDYFGGADAKYYLKDKFQPWWGERNSSELPKGSYLAISATMLQGGRGWVKPGSDIKHGYYSWLNRYEPIARIGYSIFVYRID